MFFFSQKLTTNEKMNRTPTVLINAIYQSCRLLLYYTQAPSQMFNVKIFRNFDTGVQKNIVCFYPILAVTGAKNNSKLIKDNENHTSQNGRHLSLHKKIWKTLRLLR